MNNNTGSRTRTVRIKTRSALTMPRKYAEGLTIHLNRRTWFLLLWALIPAAAFTFFYWRVLFRTDLLSGPSETLPRFLIAYAGSAMNFLFIDAWLDRKLEERAWLKVPITLIETAGLAILCVAVGQAIGLQSRAVGNEIWDKCIKQARLIDCKDELSLPYNQRVFYTMAREQRQIISGRYPSLRIHILEEP